MEVLNLIKILFVCLGNICRSPMAEAIFRDLVTKKGMEKDFYIDSAGTCSYHIGSDPHEGTRNILKTQGISYKGIRARQINKNDFNEFNYIIAMDSQNLKDIKDIFHKSSDVKIAKLLDYVNDKDIKEVPDPYYSGGFDEVYKLILKGCEKLLDEVLNNK